MEKYRIAFTVQDYYSYIGTNPYYGVKECMLHSIPERFKKNGYNIKFKKIKKHWDTWYRVHMSVKMSEEEIQKVLNWHKNADFKLENVSYKLITKHF
jgi:hypothetical protein